MQIYPHRVVAERNLTDETPLDFTEKCKLPFAPPRIPREINLHKIK